MQQPALLEVIQQKQFLNSLSIQNMLQRIIQVGNTERNTTIMTIMTSYYDYYPCKFELGERVVPTDSLATFPAL